MIAALHVMPPPALIAPAPVEQVRKRKRSSSNQTENAPPVRRGVPAWVFIGTVILLADGSECTVVAIEGDRIYCAP